MIKLHAAGNVLTCVRSEPIVQGQQQTIIAEVTLSAEWAGYNVLVAWRGSGTERSVALSNGKCIVPWEVLTRATSLTVAVTGTLGEKVLSTSYALVGQILPGPVASMPGGVATPTPYEHMVQAAQAASTSAIAAAARSEAIAVAVTAAGAALEDLPDKIAAIEELRTAIAAAANDARDSAAMTSVAASLLEQYGIISGIEAVAIPVQWYVGVASISNKFFVLRSTAAAVMTMSLDEESAPIEEPPPAEDDPPPPGEELPPIEGDEGGDGIVGEPDNPGLIIALEYAGYITGWVSGTELYLSKSSSGALTDKHTSTGRYVVLDYETSKYYICLDGVVGDELTTFDDYIIVNPAAGKLYMTDDGTYWVWSGYEYIVADLSVLIGGGKSLLERLLALEIQLNSIVDALEEVV